jgi:DNA-binding CsgD family transcriptional regulator
MREDDLFELIDRLSSAERLCDGSDMLRQVLTENGLDHVAYCGLNMPSSVHRRSIVAVTYAPEWQRHYAQKGYVDLDPIIRAGLGGILPIDWNEVDRSASAVVRFFGEAQELDVGSQGLSIPIRGRHGEFALFSVTSSVHRREWDALKRSLIRDLTVLSWNFHAFALKIERIGQNEFTGKLSPRQAACLRWIAHGKTEREVSLILGVSPATVKFHLELARSNLEAVNTTHAVARAIGLGLINLAVEP